MGFLKLWHKGETLRSSVTTMVRSSAVSPAEEVRVYDATYVVDRGSFIDIFALSNRAFDSLSVVVREELHGTLVMPSPKDYERATGITVQSEREPRGFMRRDFNSDQPVSQFTGEGINLLEVEIPLNVPIEGSKLVAAVIREGQVILKTSDGMSRLTDENEGSFFEQTSTALDTILRSLSG